MGVDNILRQQGLAPTSNPSIHVSYSDSSDIKELSGGSTLATIGFSENDEKKPKTLNVYVNLPPAPESDVAGCGCTIQ
ncbi:hypothetical protein IW148_000884 [Coemansia sp. RSA 1199]|nr:hypothetical protein IW148_000884 [Coemansia sp. RSA 1199]